MPIQKSSKKKFGARETISNKKRRIILDAYDNGEGSIRVLAKRFGVSRTFIEKLLQRRRLTGSYEVKPRAGGRQPHIHADAINFIRKLKSEQSDITLPELCRRLETEFGLRVSVSAVHRAVHNRLVFYNKT